jgi:hypothetical protein
MAETKNLVMDWDHDEHWVRGDRERIETVVILPPRRIGSFDTDVQTARADPYARDLSEVGVPHF